MKYPDAETLNQKFQLTSYIIHRQTEGISNEESVIQPPVRGNCMNWILGHILSERNFVLRLLGCELVLDEAAVERYQRESSPILGAGDGLPFDQLLKQLDESEMRIEEGLKTISEARLAEMDSVGTRSDSVGAMIAFILWHETYHTGQFELLRQLAGKNDKVI
jgi:uncharacterized damage-inducible protein DinB